MDIFKLPDLGEGLPDAEINEWFVKEGDRVKTDQPLVSMETAKAVVDVPSPQDGVIAKCYGKPGDIIKTGAPLIAFEATITQKKSDKGTVVGDLQESDHVSEDHFTVGTPKTRKNRALATPAVKLLAKKLHVDLQSISGTGEHGLITRTDVEHAAKPKEGYEPLRGVRRAMLNSMVQSHQEVVPVSIYDDADLHHWPDNADITTRLIQAITKAAITEPALNAWFDSQHSARKCFTEVNLGIAMDSDEGLFVPVIHDAAKYKPAELRKIINEYKQAVANRSITPEKLQHATITLSNFGKFAGRYASPVIVPPMVAILATGRIYQQIVDHHDQLESHPMLPLSLTFDHCAVTGGEATRFLGAVIKSLGEVG